MALGTIDPRGRQPYNPGVEIDRLLIQQLEELCDGETVHLRANLVGTYRIAVNQYTASGNGEYRELAEDSETELRSLLTRLRLKKLVGRRR